MARKRSHLLDYLVYLAVRLLVCFVQMLGWKQAYAFARFLAWLAYHLDHRHRLVALDNLRHAFPGRWTEAELDALVRQVYFHFAAVLIEIVLMPRKVFVHNHKNFVEMQNQEVIVSALLSGRPVLILTAHFGNWELAGYYLGLTGFSTHAIARPLDNPFLNRFLRDFREHSGQKILAKKGDFDQMTGLLKSGGVIATLADQDAGPRGLFVDFFGRPASTHKAIALMALEYNVPMIVSLTARLGYPMRYRIIIDEVILPEEYAGRPNAVQAITQRFTSAIERIIRDYPEQYFWLHRRWKHQPQEKRKKKAA